MEDNKSAMHQGFAGKAGEFFVGNDLRVTRLGFGSMRITGKGIWGEPTDRAGAVRVLRRAVELEINFIDTMSTLFDLAQRIYRGDSPPPPVARLIGFTFTSIAPGQ